MGRGSRTAAAASVAVRDMLADRRRSPRDIEVPLWAPMPTFENVGQYAAAYPGFDVQADYGFQWREARGMPGRRLTWNSHCGHLVLVGPMDGRSEAVLPIEILATGLHDSSQVERLLRGYPRAHNTYKDSLGWLRRTVAKRRTEV